MKRISVLLVVVVLLVGCASALNAANSIYAMSGVVVTPDDTIASNKSFVPAVTRVFTDNFDVTAYGAALGLFPNFEVSGALVDVDGHSEEMLHAKYRVFSETATKPALTVGVFDFTQNIMDEMSAFVVVSKNLTSVAEDVSGQVSKPIKGSLGYGVGSMEGFFASLDMAIAPKLSVGLEYIVEPSAFSGCVRFQPIQPLTITAGALDFEDFYAGVSYSLSTF